jgi:hypothetical protein
MDEWARPGELDVFATGDTHLLAPDQEPPPSSVGEAMRRGSAAVHDLHARPGFRLGTPIATTSGRRSGPADIVRPVLVDPRRAATLAQRYLFVEPVAGLDLDDRNADTERRYLVWTGRLSGRQVSPVCVALHLLASPSMVVTVLELVPQGRVRWHQQAFIQVGIEVVDTLAKRLTELAADAPRIGRSVLAPTA